MKLIAISGFIIAICVHTYVFAQTVQNDGHLKYHLTNTHYPRDSIYQGYVGSDATDHHLSGRINFNYDVAQWSVNTSYQLTGLYSDSLAYTRNTNENLLFRAAFQNDDARLFDLTQISNNHNKHAVVGRVDRLNISYKTDSQVIKIGRQAVSWGNGLIYNPMDFLNPFDPTAIDTEYKTGDDMLYAQHLFKNGADLQLLAVMRRNGLGQRDHAVNSVALKYHGFISSRFIANSFIDNSFIVSAEFDLLLAEHYQDTIAAIGSALSLGGSVVRGDWVFTDTGEQNFNSLVVNISYSWTVWNKNVTASIEYFYNNFGIRDNKPNFSALSLRQEWVSRIQRGELFTLNRDYLAGSALLEMAPLWRLSTNIFYNMNDRSALVQVISQYDFTQNSQVLIALSVPAGAKGSEFGGLLVNSNEPKKYNNQDGSLFIQLAWYF